MQGNFSNIIELYNRIKETSRLPKDYCVVFVYNSANKIRDYIHVSECIYPDEYDMIMNSFRKSADYVYSYDGEIAFAKAIPNLKQKHNYILVYSMAQDNDGIGRRCFIPILCNYYNLINIGAGFMESVYGGSKFLMYEMTKDLPNVNYPKTYYISSHEDIEKLFINSLKGLWLLKPNDESASIGMEVFNPEELSTEDLKTKLLNYQKQYPIFCIQEYIEGEEVAVPLLWYKNEYYCPGISQVVFHTEHKYLDYDTVALGNCSYKEYLGSLSAKLIQSSINIANRLGFKAISRIDFRIKDKIGYIEDIGPNPTLSEYNGANELFRIRLNAQSCCVYQLMLYVALEQYGLFKPSLNYSK